MAGSGELFTLFFVTLGPVKILGPFAARTEHLDPGARRAISMRVFWLGLVVVLAGGWVGRTLAMNWDLSHPALLIATGIIFFVVALNLVMEQYEPPHPAATAPLPEKPMAAALQLTFPLVVTPYGVAGVVAVLSANRDPGQLELIFAIATGIMVLNLLAMLSAQAVMRGSFAMGLRVFGAILGVLQVAMAVEIVIRGLQELEIVR
jgi:multiple antibiotic resistance protein